MKIIDILTKPLYSTEIKSSRKQLQDDFGDFPPTPLHCEKLSGDFKIHRVSLIGEIYKRSRIIHKLTKISEEEFKNLSSDISEGRTYNEIIAFQDAVRTLSIGSKWFGNILSQLMICRTISKKLIKQAKNKSTLKVKGYFNPLLDNGSQVVIKSRFNDKHWDAPVVSHEHIHLLQFRNPENHTPKAQLPDNFLSEEMRFDTHLLYILEKKEVEARLHEVVLSFFRAHRHLPVTVTGFLGLIASCEHCGSLITTLLEDEKKPYVHYEEFPAREHKMAEQLEEIFICIDRTEMACKFVTEVLPVMYGNLLKYYGSEEYSRSYMLEIKRPNFYDELYGKKSSEETGPD